MMTDAYSIALLGIIVQSGATTKQLNSILSDYGEYVIGRMGIPHRERQLNILSVALDAPQNVLNAIAGKIGVLEGISVKLVYAPTK
ncbi:MAG: TM1266 family iron-only hydrogenase system putative regulator [Bradymonadales bacterium]